MNIFTGQNFIELQAIIAKSIRLESGLGAWAHGDTMYRCNDVSNVTSLCHSLGQPSFF